jgi:hypothetical protein
MLAMFSLPIPMVCIWVISTMAQMCSLYFIMVRRHYRFLPLFTLYIALNVLQAFFLAYVYQHFGVASRQSKKLYWISEPLTLAAQALAATEVLNRVLRQYRGIWGLAWRMVTIAASAVTIYALASAGHAPDWRLMIANRGFHLTFSVALVSDLILVRVYAIPVPSLYRVLLAGFCVFSCSVVVWDTLLQTLVIAHFHDYAGVWNYLQTLVFGGIQLLWAERLRQPLPVEETPQLLPPGTYDHLSPKVNSAFRRFNDQLNRFWCLGVPQP